MFFFLSLRILTASASSRSIDNGDLTDKPGWVRISLHPTMTDEEARFTGRAVVEVIRNYKEWKEDYTFHPDNGEFTLKSGEINYPDLFKEFKPY